MLIILVLDVFFIFVTILYFAGILLGWFAFGREVLTSASFWSAFFSILSFVLAINAFAFSCKISKPDVRIYRKNFDDKKLKSCFEIKTKNKTYMCLGLNIVNYSPTSATIKDFKYIQIGVFQKKCPWFVKIEKSKTIQVDELLKSKELSHFSNLQKANKQLTINSFDSKDILFIFEVNKVKRCLFEYLLVKVAGKKKIRFFSYQGLQGVTVLDYTKKRNCPNGKSNRKKKKYKSATPSPVANTQTQSKNKANNTKKD